MRTPVKRAKYHADEISAAVDGYVHAELDRAIMRRKLLDNKTFASIAEELNIGVTTVKTIYYSYRGTCLAKYM